ncbi:hypothetical protein BY458DRAFT_500610 [Sporodiniella umbellata]|nr:hypothetical protein BY458DRAFT_500610 [Sporodiniella umbellata]
MREKQSKFTEERHERMLNDLCKLEGNNKCADCLAPNPRWTSYSLGIFLCMRCASLHRKMGTHISKVKSISMDRWSFQDIQSMKEKGGNLKINHEILSNSVNGRLPLAVDDDFDMERYVRDKWERKRFQSKELEVDTRKEVVSSTSSTLSSPQYSVSPASLCSPERTNPLNPGYLAGRASFSENRPFKTNTNPFRTTQAYNPFL